MRHPLRSIDVARVLSWAALSEASNRIFAGLQGVYRSTVAMPASTTGNDQAESPKYETAAAARMHPLKKPMRGRNEAFSRSTSAGVDAWLRKVRFIAGRMACVKLPVMTAVEGATGQTRRSSANWQAIADTAIMAATIAMMP